MLPARGITHLLLSGCTTNVCVHSTQRDATDRNFICCLVEDAARLGRRSQSAHRSPDQQLTAADFI